MEPKSVDASWEKGWPVNWEHIGTVIFKNEDPPEFILIDGIKYKKIE